MGFIDTGYNRERKLEISKKEKICGYCKYHRGENTGRKERPDKYKTKGRRNKPIYGED